VYPAAAAIGGTAASAATAPLNCAPPGVKQVLCYSPQAYEVAYGVAPLLSRGIDGSGETVVMPELASGTPGTDIRQDLATFDSKFGLPPANLHVVNTIAHSATPYLDSQEEAEDTEMVHVIAPGATLDVVLVSADATFGEMAWNGGGDASAGGYSSLFAWPYAMLLHSLPEAPSEVTPQGV
jgi:subtilase family serine protease